MPHQVKTCDGIYLTLIGPSWESVWKEKPWWLSRWQFLSLLVMKSIWMFLFWPYIFINDFQILCAHLTKIMFTYTFDFYYFSFYPILHFIETMIPIFDFLIFAFFSFSMIFKHDLNQPIIFQCRSQTYMRTFYWQNETFKLLCL